MNALFLLLPLFALAQPSPILEKNSKYECRYLSNNAFGFLFERGNDDAIHVSLITNNINEGAKSAFDAVIKATAPIGLYVYHFKRSEKFGRYMEFELRNERQAGLGNKFPGIAMITGAMYTKDKDGKEVEKLYPELNKRMSCDFPGTK